MRDHDALVTDLLDRPTYAMGQVDRLRKGVGLRALLTRLTRVARDVDLAVEFTRQASATIGVPAGKPRLTPGGDHQSRALRGLGSTHA